MLHSLCFSVFTHLENIIWSSFPKFYSLKPLQLSLPALQNRVAMIALAGRAREAKSLHWLPLMATNPFPYTRRGQGAAVRDRGKCNEAAATEFALSHMAHKGKEGPRYFRRPESRTEVRPPAPPMSLTLDMPASQPPRNMILVRQVVCRFNFLKLFVGLHAARARRVQIGEACPCATYLDRLSPSAPVHLCTHHYPIPHLHWLWRQATCSAPPQAEQVIAGVLPRANFSS